MIRKTYLHLIGDLPKVPWKGLMFKNAARAKVVFTLWLQLQRRLLTADRLLKWSVNIDPKCTLCNLMSETRDHLFVECDITKNIWGRLMQWLKLDSPIVQCLTDLHQWILHKTKGKTQLASVVKFVYTEFIYAVWMKRNTRVFEKTEKTTDIVARNITCICNVRAPISTRVLLDSCYF